MNSKRKFTFVKSRFLLVCVGIFVVSLIGLFYLLNSPSKLIEAAPPSPTFSPPIPCSDFNACNAPTAWCLDSTTPWCLYTITPGECAFGDYCPASGTIRTEGSNNVCYYLMMGCNSSGACNIKSCALAPGQTCNSAFGCVGGGSTCDNECDSFGDRECTGGDSGYRVCENNDSDICFEWSDSISCPGGETCFGGICETDPPPPLPDCDCTDWADQGCGGGVCDADKRGFTRTCDPIGCHFINACLDVAVCAAPACEPSEWINRDCGGGICSPTQRRQVRAVTPPECDIVEWCEPDSSCVRPPCNCSAPWTDAGCGEGDCDITQRRQIRACNPSECLTESDCRDDSSCKVPLGQPARDLSIFQECEGKRVKVTFEWTGAEEDLSAGLEIDGQWLDISFSNSFASDTYLDVHNSPDKNDTSYTTDDGRVGSLDSRQKHYWRINTHYADGRWNPSVIASFTTNACGTGPETKILDVPLYSQFSYADYFYVKDPGTGTRKVAHLSSCSGKASTISNSGCSLTSHSMVFDYYGKGMGVVGTANGFTDAGCNPIMGNCSGTSYSYQNAGGVLPCYSLCESNGLICNTFSANRLLDIALSISQGYPVMLGIKASCWGVNHGVVAKGYEKDASGNITMLYVNDPAGKWDTLTDPSCITAAVSVID